MIPQMVAGLICGFRSDAAAEVRILRFPSLLVSTRQIGLRAIPFLISASLCVPPAAAAQTRSALKAHLGIATQDNNAVQTLESGKTVEREIGGSQSHAYQLPLLAGQYVRLMAIQKGIRVVAVISEPDSKKVLEVELSPNFSIGPMPLSLVAAAAGNHRVEVRSPATAGQPGRYSLQVEALRPAEAADHKRVLADNAFVEAERLRVQGTAQTLKDSIKLFETALAQYRAVNDQAGEANAITGLGRSFDALGEKQKALDLYNQALPLHRATGNLSGEAYVHNYTALVYNHLGDRQKGLDQLAIALPIARKANDQRLEGVTLNNFGFIHHELGDRQKALDFYNQALPLHRAARNQRAEGNTLGSMGVTYNLLGEARTALEYLTQALPLRRAFGDPREVAGALNNIGALYKSIGENASALDFYNQAVPQFRQAGDVPGEAAVLHNIGSVLQEIGEPQKALDYYNQALTLERSVNFKPGEANTLNNIGRVYASLGMPGRALGFYNEALLIHRAVRNRSSEASTLNNIGSVQNELGDKTKALEFYEQSLTLQRAVGNRAGEGSTLNNIARIYVSLGQIEKAVDLYNKALVLHRETGNRMQEATTLINLGRVYYSSRDTEKAEDCFNQALTLKRSVGDRYGESFALYNIASAQRAHGSLAEARKNVEAALNIVESLRTKVASQELRTSYLASMQNLYALSIDVLMSLHKQNGTAGLEAAALETSERSRARSLLDTLVEAGADIRQGADPKLLERERSLQELLRAKAELQTRLLNGKHTQAQAAAAAREIDKLTNEYQDIETQIRRTSPRYASLTQPAPVSTKAIQALLDPDTLLLEYSLGDLRSYVWAVSRDSVSGFELPKGEELDAATRKVYGLLVARSKRTPGETVEQRQAAIVQAEAEYWKAASSMSKMLLGPVASQLGKKRLLIVADGVLQYLPFAALPAPDQLTGASIPLVVDHEIVTLPSASVLAVLRSDLSERKPAARTVAVLADPVFSSDDPRVKISAGTVASRNKRSETPPRNVTSSPNSDLEQAVTDMGSPDESLRLPRLLSTRDEAEQIAKLAAKSECKLALGFEASRATATASEMSQYRVVHFATHALVNSVHPELSGIALSMVDPQGARQDGFLRAFEIYNMRLPAELVVLSACQTALGQEIRGEGLIGLTRGFMYAGTPRVIASLWKVDDEATAELMGQLYGNMLRSRMTPAAALRAAQVAMWKHKRWRSPFNWASFVLQGEWR